jgi:hypothetical protein
MSSKTLKARSLSLPEKTVSISNRRRSSPVPKKTSRTPTAVKFNSHANKMIDLKALLNNLPDDLRSRITRKAVLEKTVQQKDMYKKDDEYVVIGEDISLKDIIKAFELDYFNYNDKDEYKDANKKIKVIDNETILADIYSTIGEEPDSPLTHMYRYKTINIDGTDKYNIILTHIPLFKGNLNDRDMEEFERKNITEEILNSNQGVQLNLRDKVVKYHNNNYYYIKDEYNKDIIKKLKYKDLINIFNPETEDYSKVVKKLKDLYDNYVYPAHRARPVSVRGGKKKTTKKTVKYI